MSKPIYFPGLNGIRAIAAITVVICHLDQFAEVLGLQSIGFYKKGMAGQAVNMFFVLSGFLITYLLLKEKEEKGRIEFKKFYFRRILRIWPIYYLSIILTLVLVYAGILDHSTAPLGSSIALYVFLLANVAIAFNLTVPTITPLWSVGVEEQFYAMWPWIVNKTKNYFKAFMWVIAIYMLLKLSCYFFFLKNGIYALVNYTRIDLMAIGGIGALAVFTNDKRLAILFNPIVQVIGWVVMFVMYRTGIIRISSIVDNEINSVFAFIVILNVAANAKTMLTLEHKIFNFLGKISYGIYVYHMLVIYCVGYAIHKLSFNIGNRIALNVICIALTILFAHISYKYVEQPILRKKKKYMVVASSNEKKA